jgi:hypothetical protein
LENGPPSIELFTANGSDTPPALTTAAFVELASTVTDVDLDIVEFLADGIVVATLQADAEQQEFSAEWLVNGAEFNGSHELLVRATDLEGLVTEEGPIMLQVLLESGIRDWAVEWDSGVGGNDYARACAFNEDRVLVGGRGATSMADLFGDGRIESFNPLTGALLEAGWSEHIVYPGPAAGASVSAVANFMDQPAVAIVGKQGLSIVVCRFTAAGTKTWSVSESFADATAIAAGLGHVVVAVDDGGGLGLLRSYDAATGSFEDEVVIAGALRDVVMSGDGELTAVGQLGGEIYVAHYTADLTLLWANIIPAPVGSDEALTVAENTAGQVLVGGFVTAQLGGQIDSYLALFDAAAGEEIWSVSGLGAPNGWDLLTDDAIVAVGLDDLGRSFIAAAVSTQSSFDDYVVGSYDAAGERRWVTPPLGVSLSGLCLDAVANVYTAGAISNPDPSERQNMWVAKFTP